MRNPLGNKLRMARDATLTRGDGEVFTLQVLDPVPRFPIQTFETAACVRHAKCGLRGIALQNWHCQPRWVARAGVLDYVRGWIEEHVCPSD